MLLNYTNNIPKVGHIIKRVDTSDLFWKRQPKINNGKTKNKLTYYRQVSQNHMN